MTATITSSASAAERNLRQEFVQIFYLEICWPELHVQSMVTETAEVKRKLLMDWITNVDPHCNRQEPQLPRTLIQLT